VANLSLRGLDQPTLARIKSSARRRKISVNRLIVEMLRQQYAVGGGEVFNDLDALAGSWSKADGKAFEAAVAPFAEIDAQLWAAQPAARYKVARKPAPARGASKRSGAKTKPAAGR
jgi:hypothetical protein